MGLGMLLAGGLVGGANAANDIIDQATKREEADRVRQQGIADRRDALLYEMKMKADMARQEEDVVAKGYAKAGERGAQIGNERGARELEAARTQVPNAGEFAGERITPEMIASMPPQARAIYEKQMGLTANTQLQQLRDQVQGAGEVGAPSSVRKGLLESYKEEYKADKDAKDRDLKERMDANRDDRLFARMDHQSEMLDKRLAARGGVDGASAPKVRSTKTNADGEEVAIMSDGSIKPLGIQSHAFSKAVAAGVAKMDGDLKYRKLSEDEKIALVKKRLAGASVGTGSDDDYGAGSPAATGSAQPAPGSDAASRATGDIAALEREISALKKGGTNADPRGERMMILNDELKKARGKSAAPQSAVKDNQAIKSVERKVGMTQVVPSGPHKGKTVVWDGKGWALK
ncbi:MAG: hypothetical protein JSR53_04310 [Proteobacteria bacterium]|nr:hypothetical protein [Pseudomonadota bacterium]